MASTMRTIAQIPARVKYLLTVITPEDQSTVTNVTDASCYAFTCNAGAFGESLLDSNTANALLSDANPMGDTLTLGGLYKDLGRQIVVIDPITNLRVAIFREVQEVNGAETSGVPANYPTAQFIKVWSASGAGVYVARTGPGA